ncbi:hypothetical protein DAEQUDRAFT_72203 [Daedalea quercina L-15889]|uniref:Uncharacterized protein n=1 Tax=Daedalea quercina L-15889 TaxID=1314783 RepID=A0A165L5J9_9APHY|nr:hypothetical protein DAEQUDRAFT_72203 [Daedalea quercina L-15889]
MLSEISRVQRVAAPRDTEQGECTLAPMFPLNRVLGFKLKVLNVKSNSKPVLPKVKSQRILYDTAKGGIVHSASYHADNLGYVHVSTTLEQILMQRSRCRFLSSALSVQLCGALYSASSKLSGPPAGWSVELDTTGNGKVEESENERAAASDHNMVVTTPPRFTTVHVVRTSGD